NDATRRAGQSDVADGDLRAAHNRRVVSQSSRPERDDQAGAGPYRRSRHGNLVPRDIGRQLPWRPRGWLLRVVPSADALHPGRGIRLRGGSRDVPLDAANQTTDGTRELNSTCERIEG